MQSRILSKCQKTLLCGSSLTWYSSCPFFYPSLSLLSAIGILSLGRREARGKARGDAPSANPVHHSTASKIISGSLHSAFACLCCQEIYTSGASSTTRAKLHLFRIIATIKAPLQSSAHALSSFGRRGSTSGMGLYTTAGTSSSPAAGT